MTQQKTAENTVYEKGDWYKVYQRITGNPIFFLEEFWNKLYPEYAKHLTEEEKQELFDRHRHIPLISNYEQWEKRQKREEKLKKEGYKDWEMY